MKYKLEWHNAETQQSLGIFEHETYDRTERPHCPLCGRTADWWQGQIDEDDQGNEIYGEGWYCHPCHIESELYEVSQRGI